MSRIFQRTVGELGAWIPPDEPPRLGREYVDILDWRAVQRDAVLTEIREQLTEKSAEDLFQGFDANGRAMADPARKWQRDHTARAEEFIRGLSHWTKAGLGCPKLMADFDHWSKMAFFEIDEALWLSVGFEPMLKLGKLLAKEPARDGSVNPQAEYMRRRKELFRREFNPYGREKKVVAKAVQDWVARVELDVHPAFARMLDLMTEGAGSAEALPEQSMPISNAGRFESREKMSLAKLLVAIAIDHYGYDPTAKRSDIPKEIQDMAATLGLEISQETIRKYLQLGAQHLPPDWKPDL